MASRRMVVASLTLSASALIGIAVHEGYRDEAYTPVPGDVPTIGFGETHGVKPGDRITPVRALVQLGARVDGKQREMRACLGDVPLYQHEWDAYVSLAYNIGTSAWCSSTLIRKLRAEPPDYEGACREILRWDRFKGKPLRGLTLRRQAEYRQCMGDG